MDKPILAQVLMLLALPASARERDYIEESRVVYPTRTEHFEIAETYQDKKNVHAGVQLTYEPVQADRGVSVDLFVYPTGHMAEKEAIDGGFEIMKQTFRLAEQGGRYTDVHFSEVRDVSLPGMAPAKDDESGIDLNVITLHGRSVDLEYTNESQRFRSRAVLFYRYDYLIKLRATADAFDGALLDRVVHEALEELVREVRVLSRGACELPAKEVTLFTSREPPPPGADPVSRDGSRILLLETDTKEQMAQKMVTSVFRRLENGCVKNFRGSRGKLEKDQAYATIKFPRGFWTPGKPGGEAR